MVEVSWIHSAFTQSALHLAAILGHIGQAIAGRDVEEIIEEPLPGVRKRPVPATGRNSLGNEVRLREQHYD